MIKERTEFCAKIIRYVTPGNKEQELTNKGIIA